MTSAGAVLCWGFNGAGQLGDGSSTTRLTPVAISGLPSGVTAIAAGSSHSCAVTSAGAVVCWGHNVSGQLGDGSSGTNRLSPVPVSGLSSGVAAIAAGFTHTCALTNAGAVLCWGNNASGQLGDGSSGTNRLTPVAVSGLSSGVSAIATGNNHSCAVTMAGAVLCWGNNANGQLGDGSSGTNRLTPGPVSGLSSGVTAIATGGSHTCAVASAGAVLCWGNNGNSQLGDGSTMNRLTPVAVSGLSGGVAAIAAGGNHSCAVTSAGAALCWGSGFRGQLGDGNVFDRPTPVAVSGLSSGVAAIATGTLHTCAVTSAGAVLCWGFDGSGRLGDGTTSNRLTPVPVSGLSSGVAAIATGFSHTCAANSAGAALCWGINDSGQLGDGSATTRMSQVPVSGLSSGVTAIAAGAFHTCAVTSAGALLCWGNGLGGQLGDGSTQNRLTPVAVSGLSTGVTAIATGGSHTCAVTSTGAAQCWGENLSGQLGDGSTTRRLTPVAVSGLSSGVTAIATANNHTCAVTSAGAVLCWGANSGGQLGDGSTTQRLTPVAVSGLSSGVLAIKTGTSHTCALTSAGSVLCWGLNGNGQVGDGSITQRLTPVAVTGLSSGVTAIAAKVDHTCAVGAGAARCWGLNTRGQLGDGSTTNRPTPWTVSGLSNGVAAIAAGGSHSCAVTSAGAALCWGSNANFQLGIGGRDHRLPAPVVVSSELLFANGFE